MSTVELNRSHSTETSQPALGGNRAWIVWATAVVFVLWLFNVQTGWAILNSRVQDTLHLKDSQLGLIAGVYTWVFAIAQLFSGALLDRLGSRKVLLPAIAIMLTGVVIFASAQNFAMVLLSQVVLAIGACAGFVGAGYVGGVWFGMAKFGFMFGLVQVFAALSSAFGQAGFDAALRSFSWREVLWGFAIFGVLLLIVAFAVIRNPVEPDTSGLTPGAFIGGVFHNIGQVLKNGQVDLITVSGAITFGIQLALGVLWMPKLAMSHGISESKSNLCAAALWAGLAVGSLFMNHLTDAMKSRKIPFLISNLIMTAALAGATYLHVNTTSALILAFIFGLANAGHMLAFTIAGDNVPVSLIGTASSVVNGGMFVVGGILLSLPGNMLPESGATLSDYQKPMGAFVGLLAIATIVGMLVRESYPKEGHTS